MYKIQLKPKIKVRLAELDMKQVELAEKLGITKQSMNILCSGKSYPTVEKLFLISHLLDCKVDDLYTYTVTIEEE